MGGWRKWAGQEGGCGGEDDGVMRGSERRCEGALHALSGDGGGGAEVQKERRWFR